MSVATSCVSMVAELGSDPRQSGLPNGEPATPGTEPRSVARAGSLASDPHTPAAAGERRRAMAATIKAGTVQLLVSRFTDEAQKNTDANSDLKKSTVEKKSDPDPKTNNTEKDGDSEENADRSDEYATYKHEVFDESGRIIEEDAPPGLELGTSASRRPGPSQVRVAFDDQVYSLNVAAETTVIELKKRLCTMMTARTGDEAGVSPADFWLTVPPGKPIHDDQAFQDIHLSKSDVIVANFRGKGGTQPRPVLPEYVSPQGSHEPASRPPLQAPGRGRSASLRPDGRSRRGGPTSAGARARAARCAPPTGRRAAHTRQARTRR